MATEVWHRAKTLQGIPLEPGLVLPHMRVADIKAQVVANHRVAPQVVLATPCDRLGAQVCGEGEVPDHAPGTSLALRWNLARDRPLHTDEWAIESDLMRVLDDRWHVAARRDGGNDPFRARRANRVNGALRNHAAVGEQRAVKIHDEQSDWECRFHCHARYPLRRISAMRSRPERSPRMATRQPMPRPSASRATSSP